jgi:hypothetical protein
MVPWFNGFEHLRFIDRTSVANIYVSPSKSKSSRNASM